MTALPRQNHEHGVLPDGWRTVRLGEVGEIGAGVTLGKLFLHQQTRAVPYLRVANVKDGYLDLSDVNQLTLPEREIRKCLLQQGDLLLTEGGDPDKLGRGTVWEGQLPECVHQNHIFRVRFNPEQIQPKFVAFELQSPYGKDYFLRHAKQTTGIATINQRVLANFPLMLPPLAEQRAIVARIERDMAEVARLRAAAERQKDSIRSLMARQLDEFFEVEEQEFRHVELREVTSIAGGMQKTPARAPSTFFRPYLTVRNVQRGWLDLTEVEQFELTPTELQRYRLEIGDILIVEGNGSRDQIGRNAIFRDEIAECIHQNHLIRVRAREIAAIPDFVSAYLNSSVGTAQLLKQAETTTGLYTLSVSKIERLRIPLLPLHEQATVVERAKLLSSSNSYLQTQLRQQTDAIEALPGALLREVFGEDSP